MKKTEGGCHNDQPAIVSANAPDPDTCDWLGVKHAAIHGVDQVQHIVLKQQVHVFPLDKQTNKHTHTFFKCHHKKMHPYFLKHKTLQDSRSKVKGFFVLLFYKVHLPVCAGRCVYVCVPKWIIKPQKEGKGDEGLLKKGWSSLSLSVCRVTLNTTTTQRRKDFMTLLHFPLFILPSSIHLLTHISQNCEICFTPPLS